MSRQSFGKPPVTVLQEFCAKQNITHPVYEWVDSDTGSFMCKVDVGGFEAHGSGRSKREAKHDAAANIIKKIKIAFPDIDEIPQAPHIPTPTADMIITLRDYCVQHNHPLPTFEIVQQTGPAEAPEFTVLCTLSTIKRYGKASNKKDARQKAALEVLKLILEDGNVEHHMQVATIENKFEDLEAERYQKFKTYREFTDSKSGETPGVLLCDRHNYFTKFFDELKAAARKIINTEYENEKTKALDILSSLKITPKISKLIATNTVEPHSFIELNCEYDVVFAGPDCKIYADIITYFTDML